MNIRITLSATLAAAALFALAPAQAQAPSTGSNIETRRREAHIALLQAQINALQGDIKMLQAQLRAESPAPVAGSKDQLPNLTLPNLTLPNVQKPFLLPNVPRYYNIPDCHLIFIKQTAAR